MVVPTRGASPYVAGRGHVPQVHRGIPQLPAGSSRYYYQPNRAYPSRGVSIERLTREAMALQKASEASYERQRKDTIDFLEHLSDIAAKENLLRIRVKGAAQIISEAEKIVNADGSDGDDDAGDAYPMIGAACAKCHRGDASKGGFTLDDPQGVDVANALSQISSGTMPPDANDLSDRDRLGLVQEFLQLAKGTK